MPSNSGAGYRFGPYVLNLERLCLEDGDARIELRPKAFDVLRALIENRGRVVSKDELVAAVWPNVIVNDDSLAQCIRDIRKALNSDGEQYIRTVPRRGYEFIAPASPLASTEAAAPRTTARPAAWSRWRAAVLAAACLAVASVAYAAWGGWLKREPSAGDERPPVALLPFAISEASPGDDWLAEGIAEDITTAVSSRFRNLTVIARNSDFRYQNAPADPRGVGAELGADYLLQGSIRRRGDRVRITVQVVEARTAIARWFDRYDRPLSDLFALEYEVAEMAAAQLAAQAKQPAVARPRSRPPKSIEVYELALRGRNAYRTFSQDGLLEAQALAERAIGLDPHYHAAWELLAAALLQLYIQPNDERQGKPELLERARRAAETSAWLNPHYAMGQPLLATILLHTGEHDASMEAAQKALSLSPNDSLAQATYATVQTFAGEFGEAINSWERAERVAPFIPAIDLALSAIPHIMLRQFEPALRLTQSCAQRAPELQTCLPYLAIAAAELGLEHEAAEAVDRLLEINPDYTIERHLRTAPWRDQADAARLARLMRRAGIPE